MTSVPSEHPDSSLLSLSIAAANATPLVISRESSREGASSLTPGSINGASSLPSGGHSNTTPKVQSALKHRRLSSTGQVKRRMSDAREAASRPSAMTIQTAAAALSSMATLSLGSPPPRDVPQTSTSFTSAVGMIQFDSSDASAVKEEHEERQSVPPTQPVEISAGGGMSFKVGGGKKRSTIFKCESCSKVYRHPSCLIKHRWEHSPHWREASKFLLSKHQQVQLLEAAAILSHMSPSNNGGASLPEDRSLWPSFLSGGAMPPPLPSNGATPEAGQSVVGAQKFMPFETHQPLRASSSVPAQSVLSSSRSGSAGPRMYDYSIPVTGGVTHVRPGVLTVSTGTSPAPSPAPQAAPRPVAVPVPIMNASYRDTTQSDNWGSPVSLTQSSSLLSSALGTRSYETGGSWSFAHSSVRSRSTSSPKSDEDEYVRVDGDETFDTHGFGFVSRGRTSATRHMWKDEEDESITVRIQEKIEEEWDGMEMEMEM